nr:DUF4474 domain-containing protein [Clostridium frigoris]
MVQEELGKEGLRKVLIIVVGKKDIYIETDRIIQEKNKLLCDRYADITKAYDNLSDKIVAIQRQAPDIYKKIIKMGINKNLLIYYKKIKNYLK